MGVGLLNETLFFVGRFQDATYIVGKVENVSSKECSCRWELPSLF